MYVYKLTTKFECSQCKFVSKASVDTEFLFNFIGHASKAMSAKVGIWNRILDFVSKHTHIEIPRWGSTTPSLLVQQMIVGKNLKTLNFRVYTDISWCIQKTWCGDPWILTHLAISIYCPHMSHFFNKLR